MQPAKLYYSEPYTRSFKALVRSCTKKDDIYEIQLDKTPFYPEGGGQPSDTGQIGCSSITHVYEKNGTITHIGDKPLNTGEIYDANIHWPRRFDHMQHHSAEHLVSGIIHKRYGADNVGFNIGEQYVTIDFNTELDKKAIENIEFLANEAIFKNLPIKVEYFDNTPPFSYRSKKELVGIIRIVTIDDYDVCACAGTQLKSTGEIGIVKIISCVKYKSGSRLYMLCGHRALKDYRLKEDNISAIGSLLSAKPYEVSDYVHKLFEEKESLKFDLLRAKYELIDIKSKEILPADNILLFEADLTQEEMKRYYENLAEKAPLIAIFSGCDSQSYRYMVSADTIDVKDLNTKLNGKGGGKGTAFGQVTASKIKIEKYFNK
ncbi:MAG: alanyl-tRNA editing protein [Defluviitaleaceae bacterium]|nr:alanyl-tRNA editing protein [Defluviitaleaceae bacterium]